MKHIRKKQEPASFSNWKAQANDDWRPAHENFQGEIKSCKIAHIWLSV